MYKKGINIKYNVTNAYPSLTKNTCLSEEEGRKEHFIVVAHFVSVVSCVYSVGLL